MKRNDLLAIAIVCFVIAVLALEAANAWDRESDIEEFQQQQDTTRKSEGRWAATRAESSVCCPLERGENGPFGLDPYMGSHPGSPRPSISLVGFGQRESTSEQMPPVHDRGRDQQARKPAPTLLGGRL